jgi:hypothetical protein
MADVEAKGCGCNTTQSEPASFIYAVGSVRPHFPGIAVEKEFCHAWGQPWPHGGPDLATVYEVLSKPENHYIARRMCWILNFDGIDSLLVVPNDPGDLSLLLGALHARVQKKHDHQLVVGLIGPPAPPWACHGIQLPVVVFDQLLTFNADELIKTLPVPANIPEATFRENGEELLELILRRAHGFGTTDEHRAVTFLAMQYHGIYDWFAQAKAAGESLVNVAVRPSPMSTARNVVDVLLELQNDKTAAVRRALARVDVTDEFPFLVSRLGACVDRWDS